MQHDNIFSFYKRISSKSWYDILNDSSKKVVSLKRKDTNCQPIAWKDNISNSMQVISNLVKKADWGVLARNANLVYVGSKSLYKVFDW